MRNRPLRNLSLLALTLIVFSSARVSHAVILYRSATRNTSPPTGSLLNSGWQFEGQWGNFLGTPIAPTGATSTKFFITAAHVGGAGSFQYNGTQYLVDTTFGSQGQI